jgi:hypothetical protein
VLQLPVATQHPEPVETGHVARSCDSRVALNRVSPTTGIASILMPNQGTVLLWQTFRSTAIGLSIALEQSFRRWKAHRQRPILTAEKIEAIVPTVTPPKKPSAHKPEKKIEVNAVA